MIQRTTNLAGFNLETINFVSNDTRINVPSPEINSGRFMYIRINDLALDQLDLIASMKLRLLVDRGQNGTVIRIRRVTNNITGNINHNTNIVNSEVIAEHRITRRSTGNLNEVPYFAEFDLTDVALLWQGQRSRTTIISVEATQSTWLRTSFFVHDWGTYPMLTIEEACHTGVSSNQDLSDFDTGFAGTSLVNNFTGSVTQFFEGFSTASVRAPINIGAFNTHRRPRVNVVETKSLPLGWRMSFDYGVSIMNNRITIVSADQTVNQYQKVWSVTAKEKFNITTSHNDVYVNLNDHSYIEVNGNILTIIDKEQNRMEMFSNGLMRSINRSDGVNISFLSENNRIRTIIADGHTIHLLYNQNNFLEIVNFMNENKRLLFIYDGVHTLQRINLIDVLTWGDENGYHSGNESPFKTLFTAEYLYNSSANIIRVVSLKENIATSFTYMVGRISRVSNQTFNPSRDGEWMLFVFRNHDSSIQIKDFSGKSIFHYYNRYGLVIQKVDENLNAIATSYQTTDDWTGRMVLNSNSTVIEHSSTEVLNHSFDVVDPYNLDIDSLYNEPRFFAWQANNPNLVNITTGGLSGRQILKVKCVGSSNIIRQIIRLNRGNYNLSFFSRRVHAMQDFIVRVNLHNANLDNPSVNSLPGRFHWTKYEINNINIPNDDMVVTIEIDCSQILSGFVYFDNFQTKVTETSKTNLVNNGFFKYSTNNFPRGWERSLFSMSNFGQTVNIHNSAPLDNALGRRAFQFNAAQTRQSILQRILVSGNANEEISLVSWIRGDINQARLAQIRVGFHGNSWENFTFDITDQTKEWQMIINKVMPTRKYNQIMIEYSYIGDAPLLIAGVQLFQSNVGSYYEYDKKGNVLTLAQTADTRSTLSYDVEDKVTRIADNAGNITKFIYDGNRRLSDIHDHNRNIVRFSYDRNNNVIGTRIQSSIGIIKLKQEYDNRNQLIKQNDEFGNQTLMSYDNLGRVIRETNANEAISNFTYDSHGNITMISQTDGNEIALNKFDYNDDLSLKSITAENGVHYQFEYDECGKVTRVLANNIVLATYSYDRLFGGINSGVMTRQTFGENPNEAFSFTYNDNNQIKRITFGNIIIAEYHYNEKNQVIRIDANNAQKYFSYDNAGNLIKEVNGINVLGYEYDNLNNLQKFSYNLGGGAVRSYDYEYTNEYAGYNSSGIRERMLRTFTDDDISTYDDSLLGVNGFKPNELLPKEIIFNNEIGADFNIIRNTISYSLNTVMSTRWNIDNQEAIRTWRVRFDNNKAIYGYFKFQNLTAEEQFLRLSNSSNLRVSIITRLVNNYYTFRVRWTPANGNSITSNEIRIRKTKNWYFIGLNIRGGNILLQVDNESVTLQATTINSRELNHMAIGRDGRGLLRTNIFMLGIGATIHNTQSFGAIAHQLTRTLELRKNMTPKSGVQFERNAIYNGFHTVSLNGTLTSKLGVNPIMHVDVEPGFSVDKLRLFEYDVVNQRHVYGSYDGSRSLAANRSSLAYKFDIREKGSLSIRFKPILAGGNQRVIFENRNENNIFGISLNPDNTLRLYTTFEREDLAGFICQNNVWHTVFLTWNQTTFTMRINNHELTVKDIMNYENMQTNVGASITNNGDSSNWLNGQLEMLTFTPYLPRTSFISAILNNNPYASVKTHVDVLGRATKEVINTGRREFISEFNYTVPTSGDSTTSLQVNHIKRSNGDEIQYEYDKLGNVTLMQNRNSYQRFEYDYLSRLIREEDSAGIETRYTYVGNGNIHTKKIFELGGSQPIESYLYQYDPIWPDRLVKIIDKVFDKETEINYDSAYAGNPSSIGNRVFQWRGRRLMGINNNIRYEYNEAGIRTMKFANGQITRYHFNGSDIIRETSSYIINYHYNERGLLVGFEFGNQNFFYVRDLLGIITDVINEQGEIQVSYRYDAWGKIVGRTVNNQNINNINRFVYKGYYLDSETDYYYLKTRYYDPNMIRFVNADDLNYLNKEKIGGLNLFVYCNNNPVMMVDENGTAPRWLRWTGVAVGSVLLASAIVVLTIGTAGLGTGLLAMTVLGAAKGTLIGAGVGTAIGALIGGALTDWSVDGILAGAMIGFGSGALIGAAIGGSLSYLAFTPNKITGFTRHGLNQVISRNGHGVSSRALLDTMRAPISITKRGLFRSTYKFLGKNAVVVLNKKGKLVTAWAKNKKSRRIGVGLLWLGLWFPERN
ncbi:MAG: hypothetical protein FWE36_00220 [Erysipelotrichales bacterium]|nr:hypothetical protein [Erysipelotrichales bacterium]